MGKEKFLFVLVIIAHGVATYTDDEAYEEEKMIYKSALEFAKECGAKEMSLCLKEKALRYIDSLPSEMEIGGVKIKSNGAHPRREPLEKLPEEPRARESALESILWERIGEYLSTHSLEIQLPKDSMQGLEKGTEEGRGKGGGGGGKKGGGGGDRMKGMMMMLMMKAAILGAIALKVIGLIAFKALLLAKIAFTISAVITLKKLLEHKHHTSTYEVIAAHPHHDFDRSFIPDQLAYKGYDGVGRNIH
ncbi:uncharacterized protein LOC132703729 [Cylas formicarius]|uniref:uncharacterized protein LOC132703729 n=1 Tax=Cylas formicarius TaxID=197179 RepID=UPI002958DC01|nr:uncharacterized protein LOC132703729 [Cylas formicarius]